MNTSVINMRHEKADVNCGRGSIFGNPYKTGRDGTRDDVCNKYEILFRKKYKIPFFVLK